MQPRGLDASLCSGLRALYLEARHLKRLDDVMPHANCTTSSCWSSEHEEQQRIIPSKQPMQMPLKEIHHLLVGE